MGGGPDCLGFQIRIMTRSKHSLLALAGWLAAANLLAAVPAVEKLLPEDTLLMITTPDFEAFKAAAVKSPPLAVAGSGDEAVSRQGRRRVQPGVP